MIMMFITSSAVTVSLYQAVCLVISSAIHFFVCAVCRRLLFFVPTTFFSPLPAWCGIDCWDTFHPYRNIEIFADGCTGPHTNTHARTHARTAFMHTHAQTNKQTRARMLTCLLFGFNVFIFIRRRTEFPQKQTPLRPFLTKIARRALSSLQHRTAYFIL